MKDERVESLLTVINNNDTRVVCIDQENKVSEELQEKEKKNRTITTHFTSGIFLKYASETRPLKREELRRRSREFHINVNVQRIEESKSGNHVST